MNNFVTWFVKLTGWIPYLLFFRPKIYYEDKIAQSRKIKGKAIIMPNHQSVWDFATMMFTFPFRNLHCVVAELMFKRGKFFAWFLKRLGSIPVDRYSADFTFLSNVSIVLNQNKVVEIYPESRLPLEGEETPLPFKSSVVYMALHNEAPVIPVVTNGKYFKNQRLRILIGKPIFLTELYDNSISEKENIEHLTNYLRDKIKELSNELKAKTKKKVV